MLQPNTSCSVCNKEFYASPGHKKEGWGKYCSLECRSTAMSGSGNGRWTGEKGECTCKTCGKKFRVRPSHQKKGDGKYCSMECRSAGHEKIIIKCPECGKEVAKYQCHVRRANTNGYCSQRCSGVSRYRESNQLNKGVQRGRGGKREDLNGKYFRSSWEANYARFLNFLINIKEIKCWEYEPDTFEFKEIKRGTRFYTPDFKVFCKDGSIEYHEVKGWMDKKSITRHRRMEKYYPEVKITIIDKAWFRRSGKDLQRLIPHW